MNVKHIFIFLWFFVGLIGGLFANMFLQLFLDHLFISFLPWFRHHTVILGLAEYALSVMITMAIIWIYWRRAMYPRAPEKIKNALKG